MSTFCFAACYGEGNFALDNFVDCGLFYIIDGLCLLVGQVECFI